MTLPEAQPRGKPLSIAILAMGGQGGGVLTDWIVEVAESCGWHAQSTSVPGVAQRTGATLYYIEMLPPRDGQAPVLALMPTPGDVDVVIAAELMEAGRSILRGLATPDKTLLITSIHRAYAVVEKEKPGEAIADPRAVEAAAGVAARKIIAFDMDEAARRNGTAISSPLLGALAGAGILPFPRGAFESVITAGGRGVDASLIGFAEGFESASRNDMPAARIPVPKSSELPSTLGSDKLNRLLVRLRALPITVQSLALAGLKRTIDFQDVAYGEEYLQRIENILQLDKAHGGNARDYVFTSTAAKYLANAMAYDDVIGVADLKIRSARRARIAREMNAADAPLYVIEFMHPRAEELVSLLPAGLGRYVAARPGTMKLVDRIFNRGRQIQTAKIHGFLQLYALACLRPLRRRLLRHANEMAHIESWLESATSTLLRNYDVARAILSAHRLVKGYSDTHARGQSKFDRVLSVAPLLLERQDGGQWMDRLISSALKDENGDALDGAIQTIHAL